MGFVTQNGHVGDGGVMVWWEPTWFSDVFLQLQDPNDLVVQRLGNCVDLRLKFEAWSDHHLCMAWNHPNVKHLTEIFVQRDSRNYITFLKFLENCIVNFIASSCREFPSNFFQTHS